MQTLPLNGKPAPLTLEPRLIKWNQPLAGTTYSVSRPGSPGHCSWKPENFQGKELFGFQTHAHCAGRCYSSVQAPPLHICQPHLLDLVVGTLLLNNQNKNGNSCNRARKTGKPKQTSLALRCSLGSQVIPLPRSIRKQEVRPCLGSVCSELGWKDTDWQT